jgi:hypothetical protein
LDDDEKHNDVFLEEYKTREYIEEDKKDNIVLKSDKMIVLTKKSILKNLINYRDCDNGIVYICKQEYNHILRITKNELKDETPYLNMKRLGLFGGLVPVKEIQYMIISCKRFFTMERIEKNDAPSVVSFSVYRPECSHNVVSRSHCQAGQEQGVYKIKPFKPKFVTSEQLDASPKTHRLVSSLGRDEVLRPQRTPPRTSRTLRMTRRRQRTILTTPSSPSPPDLDIQRTSSPDLDIPRSRNPSFSDGESNGGRLGRGRRNRPTKTKRLNKTKTHKLKSFRVHLRTKKGKRNKIRDTHKKRKYYKQR